jgi:hypothetical protein
MDRKQSYKGSGSQCIPLPRFLPALLGFSHTPLHTSVNGICLVVKPLMALRVLLDGWPGLSGFIFLVPVSRLWVARTRVFGEGGNDAADIMRFSCPAACIVRRARITCTLSLVRVTGDCRSPEFCKTPRPTGVLNTRYSELSSRAAHDIWANIGRKWLSRGFQITILCKLLIWSEK